MFIFDWGRLIHGYYLRACSYLLLYFWGLLNNNSITAVHHFRGLNGDSVPCQHWGVWLLIPGFIVQDRFNVKYCHFLFTVLHIVLSNQLHKLLPLLCLLNFICNLKLLKFLYFFYTGLILTDSNHAWLKRGVLTPFNISDCVRQV